MTYDFMCSDCGLEYTLNAPSGANPEARCPSCSCTDAVPILPFNEETGLPESWEQSEG